MSNTDSTTKIPMTDDELVEWCMERIEEGRSHTSHIGGTWHCDHAETRTVFANGDTLLTVSDGDNWTRDVKNYINGVLVHHTLTKYIDFGWKDVEVYL